MADETITFSHRVTVFRTELPRSRKWRWEVAVRYSDRNPWENEAEGYAWSRDGAQVKAVRRALRYADSMERAEMLILESRPRIETEKRPPAAPSELLND